MDGRTISSSKLVGSRGIMRGFLDMISFKCLEVSMMLLCCMNPINVRLTCANANFIPKEVKDSSFSGCTNHHQEDERIPQKGNEQLTGVCPQGVWWLTIHLKDHLLYCISDQQRRLANT